MGAMITFTVNWLFIPRYGYTASAWAHVACYGSMVIVSWLLGRKYYRIPYSLKRISLYVALAMIVFVCARFAGNMNTAAELLVNTAFFAGFSIIVILFERKNIANLNE
jgi:O-antigen/teichoic acid export membrane protein